MPEAVIDMDEVAHLLEEAAGIFRAYEIIDGRTRPTHTAIVSDCASRCEAAAAALKADILPEGFGS